MKRLLILGVALAGSMSGALAQAPVLPPQAPNMPAPQQMPAEKMKPQDPTETGSTKSLSEKLNESEGVIRPPETATPDMTVRPPDPNAGTMPIIPPPGSPGGNQRIQPK